LLFLEFLMGGFPKIAPKQSVLDVSSSVDKENFHAKRKVAHETIVPNVQKDTQSETGNIN